MEEIKLSELTIKDNEQKEANTTYFNKATSKPTTKAERRALQEAQRAAKAAKKNEQQNSQQKPTVKSEAKPVAEKDLKDKKSNDTKSKSKSKESMNFKPLTHLRTFSSIQSVKILESNSQKHIHESFQVFGDKLIHNEADSSNDKCQQLLEAITALVDDFKTPAIEDFPRAFLRNFEYHMEFLNICRPISINMLNCSLYIKALLAQMIHIDECEAREAISSAANRYCQDRLLSAKDEILSMFRSETHNLINEDDTILILGRSYSALDIIKYLLSHQKRFKLIICHDEPISEHIIKVLNEHKQECLHIPLSDAIYYADQVSKVIVSAVVIFSNGCAVTVSGCTPVVESLHKRGVSCIVFCETYKFVDDTVVNSVDSNEIFDLHHLFPSSALTSRYLNYIRLKYDLLNPEFITCLVCEKGLFPANSSTSISRLKLADIPLIVV
ncbi:hypothetical protein GJ496_007906 [Pomphorhynchus laevis]|nr:hypothetical protein GJ496_007906 [Pomphorhynchus laevis]